MKKVFLLFFLWNSYLPFSQAQSSSGTEFWLAYMENLTLVFNDQPAFVLHISAESDAAGQISVPATGFSLDFSVTGGTQIEVELPTAIWYSEDSEQIEGKGIRVTSDNPIEVQATHYRLYFTEATGVLPLSELSDEYRVTCFFQENSQNPSSFVVAATQDNTEIEITPTAFTLGLQGANVPFSVTLDEGEIFQVQALSDLTGSEIRAVNGEKIAVFSGAQQANVGIDCFTGADNHLYEQSQPFNNWADLYYFVPFKNQGGDFVRILANENNTTVYFDCEEITTLDAGEYFDTEIVAATVINSTNPIAVTQYNDSQGCNPSGVGDPSMLQLLPTENQGLYATWDATPGLPGSMVNLSVHHTNVIMKTVDVGSIQLNGTDISGQFSPFPADATLSFAQLFVSAGDNKLTSSTPFQAYHYGFGDFDAYTKTGNYQQIEELNYVCLEILADGIFCVDSLINFSANSNFDITNYDWQTSDSQTSTNESPNFSFPLAGDYVVTLAATTSSGQTFTATYELTIVDCPNDPCDQNPTIELMVMDTCAGFENSFSFTSDLPFVGVQWDFGDGSAISTLESPNHVYLAGNYTVTFTGFDTFNCAYSATLAISIEECGPCGNPELTITLSGDPCPGNTLLFETNLSSTIGGFYTWDTDFGEFSFDSEFQVTAPEPGTYQVVVSVEDFFDDCFYFGEFTLVVEDCDVDCTNLPPVLLEGDNPVCVGDTAIFTVNTTANLTEFTWIVNADTLSNNPNFFEWIPNNNGNFTVQLLAFDANGCEYNGFAFVQVNFCFDPCDDYSVGNIAVFGEYCVGSLLTVTVDPLDPSTSYSWVFPDGSTGGQSFLISFGEPGPVTFFLQGENDDGCSDGTSLEIIIEECSEECVDYAVEEIQISGENCVDSTLNFTVNPPDATTTYSWAVSNGTTGNENDFSTQFSEAGTFNLMLNVENAAGCQDSTEIEVLIENCEVVDSCQFANGTLSIIQVVDLNLCEGDTVPLFFETDFPVASILWELADGRIFTDSFPPITVLTSGGISGILTVTDENGCAYQEPFVTPNYGDCVEVCPLYVPNAFSPNQDGANDEFKPISDCPPEFYELKIFNRWGALVFQTNDFLAAWDGTFNGEAVSSDVYVWMLRYNFGGEDLTTDAGDVTLIR